MRHRVMPVFCLMQTTAFRDVGGFHQEFHQLTDVETVRLLQSVAQTPPHATPRPCNPEVTLWGSVADRGGILR